MSTIAFSSYGIPQKIAHFIGINKSNFVRFDGMTYFFSSLLRLENCTFGKTSIITQETQRMSTSNKSISLLLPFLFLFATITSCKQPVSYGETEGESFPTASEVVLTMESGVNLGNVFDLGAHAFDFYELASIIVLYERAGMKHIRIPTTWMDPVNGSSLTDSEGNVNFSDPRIDVLTQVIDFAIERELYVVLNAHHERSFKANYDGSEAYNNKLRNLWTDIMPSIIKSTITISFLRFLTNRRARLGIGERRCLRSVSRR